VVNKPKPPRPKPKRIDFYVNERGCFVCTSHAKDKDGYPKIQIDKRPYRMSRFIYEQCFGEIPKGLVVRHKCDNPSCINPEHLELGTVADNNMDKVNRGRQPRLFGEKNGVAKLTKQKVKEIKRLLEKGETVKGIARKFAVTPKAIRNIRDGKSWPHVG